MSFQFWIKIFCKIVLQKRFDKFDHVWLHVIAGTDHLSMAWQKVDTNRTGEKIKPMEISLKIVYQSLLACQENSKAIFKRGLKLLAGVTA